MTVYYYENEDGYSPLFGRFNVENDEIAKKLIPETTLILYKESETNDGTPFIVVYEKKEI